MPTQIEWCADCVPLVLDAKVPDLPLNFEEDPAQAAFTYFMPSTSFTFQFREKFSDAEWLMSRSTMKRLHNGRYDMDTHIIDENGTIVASCLHTSALIPRNSGKKKHSNL
jgi:acyl-CoA thioesterase